MGSGRKWEEVGRKWHEWKGNGKEDARKWQGEWLWSGNVDITEMKFG